MPTYPFTGIEYHIVTNCIEQSISWEAHSSSASQEIPRILWISKFIIEVTRFRHLSLSWTRYIKSTTPIPLLEEPFQYYPLIYG